MKRILITGANSYIGTSFEEYMKQFEEYQIDTIDMIDGSWRQKDFSLYDTVFHVAGIAHRKETKENAPLYYEVNRDLAIETAKKAKKEQVKQFVFLSSMSIYGMTTGVITKDTVPNPNSHYGRSKLEAEQGIRELADDCFKVVIVRPPMVYGKGCKGNYVFLRKFALTCPFFIKAYNQRSMIYIDNLCEFVHQLIDKELEGIFCPQNKEYISTDEMVTEIAKCHGKKVMIVKLPKGILNLMKNGVLSKIFGSLTYSETEKLPYHIVDVFSETIRESEKES